jgi:hypothetical protein
MKIMIKSASRLVVLRLGVSAAILSGGFHVSPAAERIVQLKPSAETVACYDFLEWNISVPEPVVSNPFTDVAVGGQFTAEGEQPVIAEGFCDSEDGKLFRIRYMPSRAGLYTYTISYNEDASFNKSFTGTFEATEARKKGIVRVDPEFPAHFRYEGTKERFFWNGTTAYWLAGWDDANIRKIIDRLDRLKVTRVRAALNGRVKDGQAWFEHVSTSEFSFLLNPWVAKNPASVESPALM